jgi:molybdopterin/thiamine biosynthesis adenylyltransferase
VRRVILVDADSYDSANLGRQRIAPSDVGHLKVEVQARTLRVLAPDLHVEAYACRVEAMPAGKLRGCVMLSCVDSRLARQSINRIASRLGLIWIDAALDSAGLVRARVYAPGGDCLECNWSDRDYELLEQRMPCASDANVALPTAAPIELGAVAAGLQVALLRRLGSETPAVDELACRQWHYDVPSGRGWIGRYGGRNQGCRFDHVSWAQRPLARSAHDISVREIFALAGKGRNIALSVEGQIFVERVRCIDCGAVAGVGGRLASRLKGVACPICARAMTPAATDTLDFLSSAAVREDWLERPLAEVGIVDGDIVTLNAEGRAPVHFELGSPHAEAV